MNLLTFYESELTEQGFFKVQGVRARHLVDVLKVAEGTRVRVGQVGGGIGLAEVRAISSSEVALEVVALENPASTSNFSLVLALPRPQTLKKILELLAPMDVSTLYLVPAARVEKSYFSSVVLQEDKMEQHLRLGCEQAISTKLPKVVIYKNVRDFRREYPEIVAGGKSILAHPESKRGIWQLASELVATAASLTLNIGPEGGWVSEEVAFFERQGCVAVTLGERILRVEQAVCACFAQLDLLRRLQA